MSLRIFGSGDAKVVLWSDFKRSAAVLTTWQLHKPSALDDLKAECVRRGLWREEGNHIRRGPFPPPAPEVNVRVLSANDDPAGDGRSYLKIEPLHAPVVVFETGDAVPTAASTPVPTPSRFEATALRYQFLALDPARPELLSAVKEWTATLRIKHQLVNRGDYWELTFLALPRANGITIRYTTDGSGPQNAGASTYTSPLRVPAGTRVICAMAQAAAHNLVAMFRRLVRLPHRTHDFQQRGIGTALLRVVIESARANGFSRVTGEVKARDLANFGGLPDWYAREGFTVSRDAGRILLDHPL